MGVYLSDTNQNFNYLYFSINIYIYMASLVDTLDPRNINWQNSPHKVTPEISTKNDAKIDKLEKEQKLLSSKLKSGAYKNTNDLNAAWQLQNRSFQKILDHRDAWDKIASSHPLVNKQRERESNRFMDNAIAIQKKYDNVISKQAQKQGICGYLSKKTCSKGKDCYWFDKEDVAGKDVGCYSRKEPRKNWSIPLKKKSQATTLGTIQENPVVEEEQGGGKKKTKRRKRKRRKRKKTRRKRKRRTKRRKR
jgi:hypothetical protein